MSVQHTSEPLCDAAAFSILAFFLGVSPLARAGLELGSLLRGASPASGLSFLIVITLLNVSSPAGASSSESTRGGVCPGTGGSGENDGGLFAFLDLGSGLPDFLLGGRSSNTLSPRTLAGCLRLSLATLCGEGDAEELLSRLVLFCDTIICLRGGGLSEVSLCLLRGDDVEFCRRLGGGGGGDGDDCDICRLLTGDSLALRLWTGDLETGALIFLLGDGSVDSSLCLGAGDEEPDDEEDGALFFGAGEGLRLRAGGDDCLFTGWGDESESDDDDDGGLLLCIALCLAGEGDRDIGRRLGDPLLICGGGDGLGRPRRRTGEDELRLRLIGGGDRDRERDLNLLSYPPALPLGLILCLGGLLKETTMLSSTVPVLS